MEDVGGAIDVLGDGGAGEAELVGDGGHSRGIGTVQPAGEGDGDRGELRVVLAHEELDGAGERPCLGELLGMVNLGGVPCGEVLCDGEGHAELLGELFGQRVDLIGRVERDQRFAVRLVASVLDERNRIRVREVSGMSHGSGDDLLTPHQRTQGGKPA